MRRIENAARWPPHPGKYRHANLEAESVESSGVQWSPAEWKFRHVNLEAESVESSGVQWSPVFPIPPNLHKIFQIGF